MNKQNIVNRQLRQLVPVIIVYCVVLYYVGGAQTLCALKVILYISRTSVVGFWCMYHLSIILPWQT